MKVIGFSGKKQSGKSTAVHDIIRRVEKASGRVAELPFAAYLKKLLSDTLGIDPALFETEAGKSTTLACGMTVRQALQFIGTDVFRGHLDENAWVNAWRASLAEYRGYEWCKDSVILVPDVRFPNEVEAIQSEGGKVIRFTRAPFAHVDSHESETALDEFVEPGGDTEFDFVMDNDAMSIAQQNEAVWKLIAENGWL